MWAPDDSDEPDHPAPRSYWQTLTDEELANTQFTTSDPHGLAEVVEDLPETDEVPMVRFTYDVGGKTVICVHPGRHRHGKGLVMEYRNGTRILVGWECAEIIWGLDFEAVKKEFEWAAEKAHYLGRCFAARNAGAEFLQFLDSVIEATTIGTYQQLKTTVRALPNMAEQLDILFERHRGWLFAEDLVRDHKAEDRLVEEEERRRAEEEKGASVKLAKSALLGLAGVPEPPPPAPFKPAPQFKTITTPIGPLFGDDFFRAGRETVDRRVRDLRRRAAAALDRLTEPCDRVEELKGRVKALTDIVNDVIGEIARLEAVAAAFEPRNLTNLVRWLDSIVRDGTRYRSEDSTLIVEPDRADTIVVRVPAHYGAPSRGACLAFLAALAGR